MVGTTRGIAKVGGTWGRQPRHVLHDAGAQDVWSRAGRKAEHGGVLVIPELGRQRWDPWVHPG